ncbi:MAG TPA: UbiA-like polyprenyltransferase [Planctomycetaceae bacterium]|jgi:4-hydroxybenzoate polyprenyltransferase|nr:UbiA-like polyprenyltransferase [Planctomycetaceae bacterium]
MTEKGEGGFATVRRFFELIRFSHTVFALPFALFSAVLAWQQPGVTFRVSDVAGLLLCMVLARSASMAFNRLADRRFDAQNPRTAGRHLPAGLLSVTAVRLFTTAGAAGFVASTLLFLPNRWPLILSLPVLVFLLAYSYAKRFTSLAHFWLGAALMLSPVAAWIAITGGLAWPPVLLGLAVFFWVGGFDVIYACQDVEFDRTVQLRSIPARFGVGPALRLAAVSHLLTAVFLVALWWTAGLGPLFAAGVVAVALLLAYEHSLVRPDDLTRVNMAFFNVNAVISIGLFIVGSLDVWTRTLR